ncbi:MAG: hypothetical protein ABR990_07900 [Terracidiphilus sp.]
MNELGNPTPFGPAHQFPMTFGQILDRIYRLMRSQLKLFIAVSAVPAVATVLMMAVFFAIVFIPIFSQLPKQPDPEQMFHFLLPSMIFIMPLSLIIFALYLAASIHAAMQADLGITITFREAYQVAWKRIGRYFWLMLLIYIIAFLPMLVIELVMIVPMQLFATGKSGSLTPLVYMIPLEMLLLIAAMVYGVIIAMRLSLAFPASLAENLTARAALSRSGKLTQGAKGRIFLVLLVIYALGYAAEMVGIIVLVVVIGIGALVMAACGVQLPSVAGILGIVLASLCFAAFLYLWMSLLWSAFSTSFAVLYHDQRLRKDGFLPVPSQAGESPA